MVEFASFAFIATLAAVINGLGVVRWINALAEYLRQTGRSTQTDYWLYLFAAGFQFLLHIVLWWTLWGSRTSVTANFLMYLYMLAGPLLMVIGTSFLVPIFDSDHVDLKQHYYAARRRYTTVLMLSWVWAIFLAPIFRGGFAETLPMFLAFLLAATLQRSTDNEKAQIVAVSANWVLIILFIAMYAMELGGSAKLMIDK